MRPFTRLTTRALVLAGAAVALGVSAAPAGAAVKQCQTANLVTWLNTDANGTAGTIFYTLNFTNLGPKCTLRGYPGVSAVGRSGNQLGAAATRNTKKVRTITLNAPNTANKTLSTAHATVGIVDVGNFPSSACGATAANGLRVFPPNQKASSFIPYPFGACTKTGAKFLRITPIFA
jgi:hypothetical protein